MTKTKSEMSAYFSRIGKMGAKATFKKYGKRHMSEMGRKSAKLRQKRTSG